jgi:hypothetical protein
MTKVLLMVFTLLTILTTGTMLLCAGCAKRVYYSNVFGRYSLAQAYEQYAELFQIKQGQCLNLLTFKDGWWKADVRKIKEMGINITDLHQRYCRTTHIKVPFPMLVDYDLLCGVDDFECFHCDGCVESPL